MLNECISLHFIERADPFLSFQKHCKNSSFCFAHSTLFCCDDMKNGVAFRKFFYVERQTHQVR
jgi:hypothetical protein